MNKVLTNCSYFKKDSVDRKLLQLFMGLSGAAGAILWMGHNSRKNYNSPTFPIDNSHYKTFAARSLIDVSNVLLSSLAGASIPLSVALTVALKHQKATIAVITLAGIGGIGKIIQNEMVAQKLASEEDDVSNHPRL